MNSMYRNRFYLVQCILMSIDWKEVGIWIASPHRMRSTVWSIWAATWENQQCGSAPSNDSDQPMHPPSLFRVFAVRKKKACVLSYTLSAQRRLWSDWADAQADLSLCWADSHFVCFVMSRLIWFNVCCTCQYLTGVGFTYKEMLLVWILELVGLLYFYIWSNSYIRHVLNPYLL